jgi:hypothetical protein
VARSLVASDNFNRADGAVGANWTQLYGFWGNMLVDTNQYRGAAGSDANMSAAAWAGSGSFANDQYSSAILTDDGGGFGNAGGVIARASTDTDANRDYYFFRWSPNTGTTELGKIVNGTETILVTSTTPTWAEGDRIEIECEGTTIRGMKNGVTVSAGATFSTTDSSLASGKPGICGAQSANTPKFDDWEGGDITGAGGGSIAAISDYYRRMRTQ